MEPTTATAGQPAAIIFGTTELTAAEILSAAADLIAERGHIKEIMEGPDGKLCTYGAIATAAFGTAHVNPEMMMGPDTVNLASFREATMTLAKRIDPNMASSTSPMGVSGIICGWNNHPEHNQDNVIETLRACSGSFLDC